MKLSKKITALVIIAVLAVVAVAFMVSVSAATVTHEAEASTNNLKYARVEGSYVVFDARKDAYDEMKKVGSPGAGSMTISVVYSNGSGKSLPMEVRVNGATIISDLAFPSTGSWSTWRTLNLTATLKASSDNVVRLKTRTADGGPRLDKIVINGSGTNPTTNPTVNPTSNPTTNPTPTSSGGGGSASYTTNSDGTITVNSGTFDGGGKSYGSNIGNGSQDEDQPPVFILMPGANLRNCRIVPPAGDGVHVHGNNVVENCTWTDVGEDALSMRSSFEGGNVTVTNCTFNNADDKVLQFNRSCTVYTNNCVVNTASKFIRQNGGTTFAMTIYINGFTGTNIDEAIVRSDSPSCRVYYRNITCNLPSSEWWMGKLVASAY